ncbi:MAG: hypothetical protein EPN88_13780 [Bacteroidetes bacterium]|nr:MAG: hypothetical protein EPN88_13780 [Bacteroidota bacterium]
MWGKCIICEKEFDLKCNHTKDYIYILEVCGENCFLQYIKNEFTNIFSYSFIKSDTIKNTEFKSRAELCFARFLNKYNIIWKYEPDKIKLNSNKVYIPDFYLPEYKIYIEVKYGLWESGAYSKFKEFESTYSVILINKEFMKRINIKYE